MGFKRHKIVWLAIVLLVLLSGLTYAFGRQAIYNQLNYWMLIPRPERLTELYFDNSTNLPTTYTVNEKQTVEFTIHNIEYRTTTYDYTITQSSEDGKTSKVLASDNLSLGQNQMQAVEVPVTFADLGSRSQIGVRLTFDGIAFGQNNLSQQTQLIFYWVNKGGQKS